MKGLYAALFVAIALASLNTGTFAYTLTWEGDSTNIIVYATQTCTLDVRRTSPRENILPNWRLVWSADGDTAEAIAPVALWGSDYGLYQSSLLSRSDIEAEAREHNVEFDATDPPCTDCLLQYAISIPAGCAVTFELIAPPGSTTEYPDGPMTRPRATVNGGAMDPVRATLTGVSAIRTGDDVLLTASGFALQSAELAALFDSNATLISNGQILARSAREIRCRFQGLVGDGPYEFVIGESTLVWASLPAEVDDSEEEIAKQIVLRVHPGVLSANAPNPTELGDYDIESVDLETALFASGVETLEPLFPEFGTQGRYTLNLAGEPIVLDDLSTIYLASVDEPSNKAHAAQTLRECSAVQYVEEVPLEHVSMATANDSLFPEQWALRNQGLSLCGTWPAVAGVDIGAQGAWDYTFGASSESVVVIDDGLDIKHREFQNHFLLGPSFLLAGGNAVDTLTSIRHGTACAGIIAALTNNSVGLAGIAGGAIPVAVRVLDGGGNGTKARVSQGIDWATRRGYPILSLSLGFGSGEIFGDTTGFPLLRDVCLNGFNKGQFIAAAMGNSNQFGQFYPAAFTKRTIGVGATAPAGVRWQDAIYYPGESGGSNYGPWIDFAAPGGIFMIAPRVGPYGYWDLSDCTAEGWTYFTGTSSATPVVTGVAALVKSAMPSLVGEDIARVLRMSAVDLPPAGFDDSTGYGMVKADAALNYLSPSLKTIVHGTIGAYGNSGALAVIESTVVTRTFTGVPGLPSDQYPNAVLYRLGGVGTFSTSFSGIPDAWPRSSGTLGWRDTTNFDWGYEVNEATVISGTLSSTSCSLTTAVYRLPGHGWFPTSPDSARIAFSALGYPSGVAVEKLASGTRLSIRSVPNPVRASCSLEFTVPQRSHVRLRIFDAGGRLVRTLVNSVVEAGTHSRAWDSRNNSGTRTPPGVYFSVLDAGAARVDSKFVVLSESR